MLDQLLGSDGAAHAPSSAKVARKLLRGDTAGASINAACISANTREQSSAARVKRDRQ